MSIHFDHDALAPVDGPSSGTPMDQIPSASGLPALRGSPGASLATLSRGVATTLTACAAVLKTALVSILGAGAIMLTVEAVAPVDWRPSTLIGTFGGRQEAAHILSVLAARRAEVAMQQEELARAQQETLVIQANNERVTQAYAALFQRGNMMAQAWAQATSQALLLDTQNRIRGLDGGRNTKIVVVTASAFASERDDVMAAGVDDFIRKPYQPTEIFDCMARHLGLRRVLKRTEKEQRSVPLSKADFETLPRELVDELRTEIVRLDRERIQGVITKISRSNPAIGQQLTQMAAF